MKDAEFAIQILGDDQWKKDGLSIRDGICLWGLGLESRGAEMHLNSRPHTQEGSVLGSSWPVFIVPIPFAAIALLCPAMRYPYNNQDFIF